jgi:uncharacterized protein DUF6387
MLDQSKKKRRFLKSLPQWFHSDAYSNADALDPIGWYAQISVRQVCFYQLGQMRESVRTVPEWDDAVQRALSALRERPICDLTCSPFDHEAFNSCRDVRFPQVPVVRSMALRDLYRIDRSMRTRLTQDQVDQAHRLAGDSSLKGSLRFLYTPEWMKATVDVECFEHGYMPVMIDLKFPNQVLKKHFVKHLQRLRRLPGGKPEEAGKKLPDLGEWAKIGLLLCMDLLLWEEEEQGRIPDSLIADALGSRRNADEEKVRKTIRPLATKLLHPIRDSTLNERLRALAYKQWV